MDSALFFHLGMELDITALQIVLKLFGVDLGGGNIGMAQNFLHHGHVSAVFQQMHGKGMAQDLGCDLLVDPCCGGPGFD